MSTVARPRFQAETDAASTQPSTSRADERVLGMRRAAEPAGRLASGPQSAVLDDRVCWSTVAGILP